MEQYEILFDFLGRKGHTEMEKKEEKGVHIFIHIWMYAFVTNATIYMDVDKKLLSSD
jgi:hypothetical protein